MSDTSRETPRILYVPEVARVLRRSELSKLEVIPTIDTEQLVRDAVLPKVLLTPRTLAWLLRPGFGRALHATTVMLARDANPCFRSATRFLR